MGNNNKVLDILKKSDKALKAVEIADIAGIDKKDVDKAMQQLKKEEKIFSPKRCYWSAK
ncbi:MAG TPA: MarR family transcriptional regulator [Bacteroidales bacterium]|jgi:predicted Zn-ribbon and HTH transcriptional regulator|nr:MarR family transcriptional regulator [Bacteroidales bacterium]HXK82322.1 MarR family transcriptional regulator [Bacteroidales bacterium]